MRWRVDGGKGRVRGRRNPGRQGVRWRYHAIGHVVRWWRHFGHRPLHRYCRLWRNGKRLVRHTLQQKRQRLDYLEFAFWYPTI